MRALASQSPVPAEGRRRRRRPGNGSATGVVGQATVELAIGATVLVTVILFGIHFAEVAYLSLKVQEAGAYATWEATGRRVQDLAVGNDDPFDRIVSGPTAVDSAAAAAYRDFNGLQSVDTGAVVVKGLTRGAGLDVRCRENRQLTFEPTPTVARAYFDRGGLDCRADARLSAVSLPLQFLEDADGLFSARHYDARGAASGGQLQICSVGKAVSGRCSGSLAILLNDWGLAGDAERAECRLGVGNLNACNSNTGGAPAPAPNTIYKEAVRRMWSPAFTRSVQHALQYAGAAPASPNEFWFSYAGLESGYLTTVGGEGTAEWMTGGPGVGSSNVPDLTVARDCFLGRAGPGCP